MKLEEGIHITIAIKQAEVEDSQRLRVYKCCHIKTLDHW